MPSSHHQLFFKSSYACDSRNDEANSLAFERFEVGDDVADLTGVEAKFRHGRVTGHDAFGQRFLQIVDRIALVQRAERRRDREGTVTDLSDRMTARAIGANDDQAA